MGNPRELRIGIELDPWEEQALASAYERLGLTTDREPTVLQLQAILLDIWTGFIDDLRHSFLNHLAYAVRANPEIPLNERQLLSASRIERAWLDGDRPSREEALKRLGAWQTNHGRFWTLTVKSPALVEVDL